MNIVEMKRNGLGDTRTASHMPTREEFYDANLSHIEDVINLTAAFSIELLDRVGNHDWTKVKAPYSEMFYDLMKATIENGADFDSGKWANLHYNVLERHHLMRYCPDDVTLFDVMEMIFDCVSAGMARSGSVYPIKLSDEILQKAISNTVDYLVRHIKVIGDELDVMQVPKYLLIDRYDKEPSCTTCGYSPNTSVCDTCEGYSNWWPFNTQPIDCGGTKK